MVPWSLTSAPTLGAGPLAPAGKSGLSVAYAPLATSYLNAVGPVPRMFPTATSVALTRLSSLAPGTFTARVPLTASHTNGIWRRPLEFEHTHVCAYPTTVPASLTPSASIVLIPPGGYGIVATTDPLPASNTVRSPTTQPWLFTPRGHRIASSGDFSVASVQVRPL